MSTPPRGRSAVAASSQSSRFHAEDVGIDLKTVNISVGARDLLKDAVGWARWLLYFCRVLRLPSACHVD